MKYFAYDFEYILSYKLSPSRGDSPIVRGLHHDFLLALEARAGLTFFDKTMFPGGFYRADVYYEGVYVKTASFFPADWSEELVENAVGEAFDDFMAQHFRPDFWDKDNCMMMGRTKSGVVIEMLVGRDGVIRLAYPVLV